MAGKHATVDVFFVANNIAYYNVCRMLRAHTATRCGCCCVFDCRQRCTHELSMKHTSPNVCNVFHWNRSDRCRTNCHRFVPIASSIFPIVCMHGPFVRIFHLPFPPAAIHTSSRCAQSRYSSGGLGGCGV